MDITFVVGAGRCGSTLLSRILHMHPEVLSVSELFSSLQGRAFVDGDLDGARFWRLLSDPQPRLDVMIREGLRIPEFIYPYDSGRFNADAGVPAICHMTLPALTADPDALYDELAAEVVHWLPAGVAEHYRRTFAWLAQRLGRRIVVERSGASLPLVAQLRRTFPEARFVHVYRHGPDSALSMSRHAGFRLMLLAQQAAHIAGVPSLLDLREEHIPLLPAPLAQLVAGRIERRIVMDSPLPVPDFGRMWSALIVDGVAELSALPRSTWATLRYEDLLIDPVGTLTRLADFLGITSPRSWLDEAARSVDPARLHISAELDPATAAELDRACAPGASVLSRQEELIGR